MGLLTGKTALITGASRGIGRAIARKFAQEGAFVVVHYGRSKNEADALVAEIAGAGGRALAAHADMGDVASIHNLFETLDTALTAATGSNRFDILVNNAAIAEYKGLEDTTEESFDRQFDVNVKGTFFTTQQAVPRLNDNGRIINVTSIVTRTNFPGVLAYSMTKGAIEVLTRHLAASLGTRGITVNTLAPGAIDTEMSSWLRTPEGEQMAVGMQSIPRVGKPEDIANAALLLASNEAAWITASYVDASGGAKL